MLTGQSDSRKIRLRHVNFFSPYAQRTGTVVGKITYCLGFSFSRITTTVARFVRLCLHCLYLNFELHHGFCMSRVKYCATLDPNGYGQWARPSLRVFILKELNAAEFEGLASETMLFHTFAGLSAEHCNHSTAV